MRAVAEPGSVRHGMVPAKGNVMGKEARTALLLAASACLLTVMVEWIVGELNSDLSALRLVRNELAARKLGLHGPAAECACPRLCGRDSGAGG